MASRRTQDYQEGSDEEIGDEDYAPLEENHAPFEENYGRFLERYARFEENYARYEELYARFEENYALHSEGSEDSEDSEDSEGSEDAEDSEDSDEEHREAEVAPSEWPEIRTAVVPSGRNDGGEEWGEGDGDEDNLHDVVTETGTSGNEGQFGTCLDSNCPPSCPICFKPWTSDGPHRVCCIPCGHVYGRSCLEGWINHLKKSIAKCPQCNARFKKNEMINLYAPIIAVPNTDVEKEVLQLREKNESLKVEFLDFNEVFMRMENTISRQSDLLSQIAEHLGVAPAMPPSGVGCRIMIKNFPDFYERFVQLDNTISWQCDLMSRIAEHIGVAPAIPPGRASTSSASTSRSLGTPTPSSPPQSPS